MALPCWALGTASGIVAGNSLPTKIVASLSVALYGIFWLLVFLRQKRSYDWTTHYYKFLIELHL